MTIPISSQKQVSATGGAFEKERKLRALMREMRSVLVAYSGGVDSAYLAYIATSELGKEARCVLGISPSVSEFQRAEAVSIAEEFAFNFETLETLEFDDPEYVANPGNRCYFCKSELFEKLTSVAKTGHIDHVIDGTNADDLGGHRPGRQAATEKSVRSPLAEIGMTKADIREMSRIHKLPSADKPASPCLSSRVAYGIPVTIERLSRIEKGEAILRKHGFREFRLREHADLARIEIVPAEFETALNAGLMSEIADAIKILGFKYVTLDLHGYRSGALNEALHARVGIHE